MLLERGADVKRPGMASWTALREFKGGEGREEPSSGGWMCHTPLQLFLF